MALAPFRLLTSTARGRLVGTSQDDDRRVLAVDRAGWFGAKADIQLIRRDVRETLGFPSH